jgi:hypothetical protein
VTVVDGIPASCTCPADEHFAGACKQNLPGENCWMTPSLLGVTCAGDLRWELQYVIYIFAPAYCIVVFGLRVIDTLV